jgi:hypothetical protein
MLMKMVLDDRDWNFASAQARIRKDPQVRFLAFGDFRWVWVKIWGEEEGMEARRWLLLLCLLVTADGLKTSTNVTFNVFSRVNQVAMHLTRS